MKQGEKLKKNYLDSKEKLQLLRNKIQKIEDGYLATHHIKNSDGSIPVYLMDIEDDSAYIQANNDCEKISDELGISAELAKAKTALKAAEDSLLEYAIKILPDCFHKEAETLRNSVKTSVGIRTKVLELTMKLDISTVDESKIAIKPNDQQAAELGSQNMNM